MGGRASGTVGSDPEDLRKLNGLRALPRILDDRVTPGRASRNSLLDSTKSSAPDFVGLADDETELVDRESFSSRLLLSSRLLGDGDRETLGEVQE